jgi:hypothetical protein
MAAPRTLKLLSKSGSVFEVEQDVLKKSALIQTLLADAGGVCAAFSQCFGVIRAGFGGVRCSFPRVFPAFSWVTVIDWYRWV